MRVPCGVWSLPVLVPLYVPVLSCHVKVQQHEVDSSILIGRLIIAMANQNGVRPLQIFFVNVICWRDKMPEFHKLRIQTQS